MAEPKPAKNDSKGCGGVMRVAPRLVEPSLRDAIVLAVNHDGDSDSTGSITGNLVGAMQGHGAIPAEWLDVLELRDAIQTLATDLASFPDWDVASDGDVWNRYPGW